MKGVWPGGSTYSWWYFQLSGSFQHRCIEYKKRTEAHSQAGGETEQKWIHRTHTHTHTQKIYLYKEQNETEETPDGDNSKVFHISSRHSAATVDEKAFRTQTNPSSTNWLTSSGERIFTAIKARHLLFFFWGHSMNQKLYTCALAYLHQNLNLHVKPPKQSKQGFLLYF